MNETVDNIIENLKKSLTLIYEKQHKKNKLSFYERIEKLVDSNSFHEIGSFVQNEKVQGVANISRDAVMTGFAKINGQNVVIASQDFTSSGGTLGYMHSKKIVNALDMAVKAKVPFIFIGDSGGARIQEGVSSLAGFGDIFYKNVKASGVIPQIAIILGPCAGGAVYSPALMDFTFMVKNISYMFVTGPKVVKEVTGEEISLEELGGADIHSYKSGVNSFYSNNENECFDKVKELLSYICHTNSNESSDISFINKKTDDYTKKIKDIIPEIMSKPYDVREVIREIVDDGKFLEVFENYSLNIFTGFARIDKKTIGIIANNPKYLAGTLDINSSCKAARFIRFCDCFNIPLLTLVDVPGYMPGSDSEKQGIIRHGAKMLYAYSESSVPKITVILRKAFGGAYIAMCSKHLGADIVFAYKNSQIAVMGAEGAVDILHSKEINTSSNPEEARRMKIEEYNSQMMNPILAAQKGYVDEIIDMDDTRIKIVNALNFYVKNQTSTSLKHGNIPL